MHTARQFQAGTYSRMQYLTHSLQVSCMVLQESIAVQLGLKWTWLLQRKKRHLSDAQPLEMQISPEDVKRYQVAVADVQCSSRQAMRFDQLVNANCLLRQTMIKPE